MTLVIRNGKIITKNRTFLEKTLLQTPSLSTKNFSCTGRKWTRNFDKENQHHNVKNNCYSVDSSYDTFQCIKTKSRKILYRKFRSHFRGKWSKLHFIRASLLVLHTIRRAVPATSPTSLGSGQQAQLLRASSGFFCLLTHDSTSYHLQAKSISCIRTASKKRGPCMYACHITEKSLI